MPVKRKGTRFLQITVGGVRRSAGTDNWEEAEALEHKLNHELWLERRMGVKPPRTWKETCVRYLKECHGEVAYREKVRHLRWWAERLSEPEDIRSITRSSVEDICTPIATADPSPGNATLNKRVSTLRHMLGKACQEWEWTERVPKFRAYPVPGPRDKWLTTEQWARLSAALPDDLREFCTFALATGLRSGKITTLTWAQYDAPRRILTVQGHKNKRANSIPLNDTAVAVLEARRSRDVRHISLVFPELRGAVVAQRWPTWKRVRELPGLEGVGPHTLRHTFNTWLAQAGIPREIRKKLMGHAEMDTHEVYTHYSDAHLRPAVAVIDRMLGGESETQRASRI